MDKYKDKLTFSRLEILCMIVLVAIFVTGGITIVALATRNQNATNLKQEAVSIISDAKTAYKYYSILENNEYIVTSSDGESKGMCITLDGLVNNDFTTKTYDKWDGYVVIEESNNNIHYSIWLTDKKYVIDGYDSSKLNELKLDKGITKYKDEKFAYNVRKKFTGTSGDKGGTGNSNGTSLKEYEANCLNEKIE